MKLITVRRDKAQYAVECFVNGKKIRQGLWRSQNKVLDILKQSGALPSRRSGRSSPMVWPTEQDETITFKVKEPANWFWLE